MGQENIPDSRASMRKRVIRAQREPRGVECTSLRRVVELELVVTSDVTSTAVLVDKLAVGEGECQVLTL